MSNEMEYTNQQGITTSDAEAITGAAGILADIMEE